MVLRIVAALRVPRSASPPKLIQIDDDDDVYYYIGERLKLEGETDNSGVIPRSDTNEVGEYGVTVTSELHAQAERRKVQKREEKAV